MTLEHKILRNILLKNEVMNMALELGILPPDFTEKRDQILFSVMMCLCMKGDPIDLVTVTDQLRARERFDEVGGTKYLVSLFDGIDFKCTDEDDSIKT